jgi:phage terminase Nu1 subunit (DNA packaging protein)
VKRDTRIDIDADFIDSPKHNNSLKRLIADHPNGAPEHVIRRVLRLTQEEVDAVYMRAIMKLRNSLKDDDV